MLLFEDAAFAAQVTEGDAKGMRLFLYSKKSKKTLKCYIGFGGYLKTDANQALGYTQVLDVPVRGYNKSILEKTMSVFAGKISSADGFAGFDKSPVYYQLLSYAAYIAPEAATKKGETKEERNQRLSRDMHNLVGEMLADGKDVARDIFGDFL